jgi:carbamoyl-phosphate synthase small subunit
MNTAQLLKEPVAVEIEARIRRAADLDEPRPTIPAAVVLEDGTRYEGLSFGHPESTAGEVVFTTGMVGYPESLTDPSYCGQILVCTYPLIGNYGVPDGSSEDGMERYLESWRIHARGLIVCDYSARYSHWNASRSLDGWLRDEKVAAITGIDTRSLTMRLRERGSMLGKIVVSGRDVPAYDPNHENLMPLVSVKEPRLFKARGAQAGRGRIALYDCGSKHNIVRSLLSRGFDVLRLPWDHDIAGEKVDGVMMSNGPGDPTYADKTIIQVRGILNRGIPTFGVCLGNQLLALAIGAKTYKLKYGHRGQNQPAIEVGTDRCFMTSQNHGFAVDEATLPADWKPWFTNLNDKTNEGIRHASGKFRSVQFHPEASPGPVDTAYLFDDFASIIKK